MSTKRTTLLTIFLAIFFLVDASKYSDFKQSDELEKWLKISFVKILAYDESQQYTLAENLCDTVLLKKWRETKTVEENDAFLNIVLYKAIYLQDKGNISQASAFFEKSLNIFKHSSRNDSSMLSFIYPKLGNNYTRLGDNENAILIHQKMLQLAIGKKDYEAKAQSLINLSIVYENKDNLSKALSILDKTEVDLNKISDFRKAIIYSLKGSYLIDINKNAVLAKQYLYKAEYLFSLPKLNADKYFLGGVYKTLALYNAKNNELLKATNYYIKSIENYKASKQNKNREIAKIYVELAKINSNESKREYLNTSLSYLTKQNDLKHIESKDIYAENAFVELLSEAIENEIDIDEQLKYFSLLFEVQNLLRKEYVFDDSKLELLQKNNEQIELALELCLKKYKENKNIKYAFKAFDFIENTKSILLFESLAKTIDLNSKTNYQDFIFKKKYLVNTLIAAKQADDKNAISEYDKELKELIFQFKIDNSEFDKMLSSNEKDKFSAQSFIENTLQDKECLLSYFVGEKNVYALQFSKNKHIFFSLKNNKEFQNDIQKFNSFFQFKNRFNFNNNIALKLGEKLFHKESFKGNKIIILTDGFFNNVPFEALRIDNEFLIENYEIQYAFSAKILESNISLKENNNELIAFAPIFKDDEVKYLKNSEQEVNSILEKIKGKQFLNQEAASEVFMQEAKDYAVIHFSTHSRIDAKTQSACIDFSDKTLYFSQIKDEQFNADLLVLSACETGIGKQKIGEGSMSISRAFAYSNIDATISSLWKVNEESSLEIFDELYKNLNNCQSISSSLRNAKLSYINNTKIAEEMKSPYYWAPYIFSGNDKVLDLKKNNKNVYFIMLLAVLLFVLFIWKLKK